MTWDTVGWALILLGLAITFGNQGWSAYCWFRDRDYRRCVDRLLRHEGEDPACDRECWSLIKSRW